MNTGREIRTRQVHCKMLRNNLEICVCLCVCLSMSFPKTDPTDLLGIRQPFFISFRQATTRAHHSGGQFNRWDIVHAQIDALKERNGEEELDSGHAFLKARLRGDEEDSAPAGFPTGHSGGILSMHGASSPSPKVISYRIRPKQYTSIEGNIWRARKATHQQTRTYTDQSINQTPNQSIDRPIINEAMNQS